MVKFRHALGKFGRGRWRQKIAGALVLAAAVFLSSPLFAFAQLSTGLEVAGSTGLGTTNPKLVIVNIIRVFLGFVGLVAVVIILYGGFKWMTSQGADDKIKQAKKTIINGVIGLVVILAAWLIVAFVVKQFGDSLFGVVDEEANRPPEFNYGLLGGGILRDVYPSPGAKDVPRNTLIMVSFKEAMATSSLIFKPETKPEQCSQVLYDQGACGYLAKIGNDLTSPTNIQIINLTQSATTTLAYDLAIVMSVDGKTFVIRPIGPIGSANGYTNYKVVLTSNIKRARNNSAAFSGTGYGWFFSVSNVLDLTPPRVVNVVPGVGANGVVKNSLIQINFSEPLNAITASGRVILGNLSQGVGNQQQFDDQANPYRLINVSYEEAGSRTYVAGDFVITNGFKTVEFTPRAICTNAQGQGVRNSCGRDVFCLPGDKNLSVLALAAAVNAVTHETTDLMSGLSDAAGNSLDGNRNGLAEGPANDNYRWQFATNNELDLEPPKIVLPLLPEHNQAGVPVNTQVKAQFNKLMSSATLINDYFALIKNGTVNNQSCTSSVTRLDPNDPAPNAVIPFPPDVLRACYPVGFSVTKEEVYLNGTATATRARLNLYGILADNSDYVSRLSDKIQDLHQNCFNPAECASNQANCPDQTGHN
ncbi:MAG: Ig-like domain-containing protein [Candidatus Komeilibacteria bacterium]|nr:Ig-like domain-containing protein [Candidatus Komeilibacteria bacterium]